MGYEELQDVRTKRAGTEAAKATKAEGSRGRKRTKASSEVNTTAPKRTIARAREKLAPVRALVQSLRAYLACM